MQRRTHAERICAGCKVPQRLPEGSLCQTCEKEWADLKRFGPLVAQLAARETRPQYIGERPFIPKAAVYVEQRTSDDNHESGTPVAIRFALAMRKLLTSTCANYPVPNRNDPYSRVMFGYNEGPARYLNYGKDTRPAIALEMTDEQVKAVHELYQSINELLLEARREGQERGQDLLQQLAAGELTSNDFDQHLTDVARFNREAQERAKRNIKDD